FSARIVMLEELARCHSAHVGIFLKTIATPRSCAVPRKRTPQRYHSRRLRTCRIGKCLMVEWAGREGPRGTRAQGGRGTGRVVTSDWLRYTPPCDYRLGI